jgi:hypothetical protein
MLGLPLWGWVGCCRAGGEGRSGLVADRREQESVADPFAFGISRMGISASAFSSSLSMGDDPVVSR